MKNADKNPLSTEIIALNQLLVERNNTLAQQEKVLAEKDKKITLLEQTITHLQLKYFGRSSERHVAQEQLSCFNEAEQIEDTTAVIDDASEATEEASETEVSEKDSAEQAETTADDASDASTQKKKPGRINFPAAWPRVKVFHELAEHEKNCSCGCELTEIDEVVSTQLSVVPAQITVIENCRKKYRCDNCKTKAPIAAPLPAQPLPKSCASPSALAYIATAKFLYGLPFYRLENMLQRDDYKLPRATQANWMIGGGNLVQPLINLLVDHQHAGKVIHIDETTVQVLNEEGREAHNKSYFWVTVGGDPDKPAYRFHYNPSRGGAVARDLLEGFKGTVISDDWSVYGGTCAALQLTHIACNDHARRKFKDAQKQQPKKSGVTKADMALNYFSKLYAIEKRIKEMPCDEKKTIRQAESVPVWDHFIEWLEKHKNQVAPESLFGKAMHYTLKLQQKLRHYCTDGALPISNEKAENAIRPFAIARKNFLFFDSPKGATASANLYSLIMSAKYNNLDPYYYLVYVFKYLPRATSVAEIEALLPWALNNDVLNNDFKNDPSYSA
jgi:transposase